MELEINKQNPQNPKATQTPRKPKVVSFITCASESSGIYHLGYSGDCFSSFCLHHALSSQSSSSVLTLYSSKIIVRTC